MIIDGPLSDIYTTSLEQKVFEDTSPITVHDILNLLLQILTHAVCEHPPITSFAHYTLTESKLLNTPCIRVWMTDSAEVKKGLQSEQESNE